MKDNGEKIDDRKRAMRHVQTLLDEVLDQLPARAVLIA